ncbi:hypothetical protein ACFYSW_30300 [Rhodococcus aetherivorans]|uniref:hypothetical protein n=1 Tax=Rhodococcus aetherivorans TaxID=191292 RepID=UPI0036A11E08
MAIDICKVVLLPEENQRLTRAGIVDPVIQRYFVWRRSALLVITCASVPLLVTNNSSALIQVVNGELPLKPVGLFPFVWALIGGFALPIGAGVGARLWLNLRKSRKLFVLGWLIHLGVALLFLSIPNEVLIDLSDQLREVERDGLAVGLSSQQAREIFLRAFRLSDATQTLHILLPLLLAFISGCCAGCMRIRLALPWSIIPSRVLRVIAPFSATVLLVLYLTVLQLSWRPEFILGGALLIVSPLLFLFGANPPASSHDPNGMQRPTSIAITLSGVTYYLGIILVAIFLFRVVLWRTADGEAFHFVGFDPTMSVQAIGVGGAVSLVLNFLVNSMIVAVLSAATVLRLTRLAWQGVLAPSAPPPTEALGQLEMLDAPEVGPTPNVGPAPPPYQDGPL